MIESKSGVIGNVIAALMLPFTIVASVSALVVLKVVNKVVPKRKR